MVENDEIHGAFDTFLIEARELLQGMEEGLLELEIASDSGDAVNAVFRTAHTLKGSAGLFGLEHVVRFSHVLETVLDSVRGGDLEVSPQLVTALLPCTDHLAALVEGIADGRTEPDEAEAAAGARLLAGLQPYLGNTARAQSAPDSSGGADVGAAHAVRRWTLRLWFGSDSFRNGMDPIAFIRYLANLGTVNKVGVLLDELPGPADFDPETCYLGFSVDLSTEAVKDEIESVFEFVREDSRISIIPAEDELEFYVRQIQSQPSSDRLGDILVRSGAVTEQEMASVLQIQQERASAGRMPPIGEILVEEGIAPSAVVDAGLSKQSRVRDVRVPGTQTVAQTLRVDAGRLDKLIDLVGELVIAQASVSVRAANGQLASLIEVQGEVLRLVEEVRHSALALRMVPIGTTLRRFERVVRDVCLDLDKEVDLVITGGDAEMDKAMVERIGDPLMHLVRNALDHGIESCGDRARCGKPSRGTLRLNAYHDAGCIVIEVADDGRGLDRDRIRARAVERGLIDAAAPMCEQEVFNLIFEPGFSTRDAVSDLSGRGVGMDVVRRNVMALRGGVEVDSTLGVGTTIRIRLPLTLAIIDGFLVGVGSASFVIPLDRVTECVELTGDAQSHDYTNLRNAVLPLVRLRTEFGIEGQPSRRQSVVVVEEAGVRTGLVVDALLGQVQTVIKPLGALFSGVRSVSGATFLGNGDVALILDVGALVAGHAARELDNHLVGAVAGC